MNSIQLCDS